MNRDHFFEHMRTPRNSGKRDWYTIRNAVDGDAATARIDLYDEIDPFWGVSAADFVADLRALDAETIQLHINSPGGSVYDGIAIMNALRQHDARVVATIDGLAASAAGFIAVGGSDELIMAENSEFMAHEAWGIAIGNAADMTKMAGDLDRLSSNIASIYAAKAGGTVDDWRAVMEAETWYTAEEAVEAGLADRVAEPAKKSAAKASFDLAIFNYAGRRAAPAPRLHQSPSARVRAEVTPGKEGAMPDLIEGLRGVLGLPEDADEATVLAAVTERVDSAGAATGETTPGEPAEPTLQQITASAKRLNLTLVDKDQYDAVVAQAEQGAKAFAKMQKQHHEKVLNEALRTGRIAKAQRDAYAAQLERDAKKGLDDTEKFLMALPKNTVVPVEELGHAGEPDAPDIDAEYQATFAQITGVPYNKKA
ncbi:ATP-dependent Clp protease proteolytic subunit [Nocardia cerradoensis]|uniref:ATP-dependent Clp protease proteolytic subunit n=1 Tax=Nocardia cerradoensis TaxID=85688 RepID=A0A231HD16_9NOCA|nr:head maturation protease, ClpP-related [Nocardia cerradoensis]OXR46665.1 ATP-dependent Clp protease proteolytic subunit [Nocardia cerradoensis]